MKKTTSTKTTNRAKDVKPIVKEVSATLKETPEQQPESAARIAFKKYIEIYKVKKPVKYESKKAELEYKLSLII